MFNLKRCLIYLPPFCSGRVTISSASLRTWLFPKKVLTAPTQHKVGKKHHAAALGWELQLPKTPSAPSPLSLSKQGTD